MKKTGSMRSGLDGSGAGRARGAWLWVLAMLLWSGCATELSGERAGSADGGVGEEEARPDDFQVLQAASGLGPKQGLPPGIVLNAPKARELLRRLSKTPVTMRGLAPRQALCWLLSDVLGAQEDELIHPEELRWRARRFESLVMVRPDGYLVEALTGEPLQRLGRLELREGEWWVGPLRVNDFYFSNAGVFYPVNEALRNAGGPPLAELGLGRDPLDAALDGAQEAMGEMGVALGQSITHPIRTVEDLAQLPRTVALLMASSPEYFARFGNMSREDQIREAARVSTHLMLLLGSGEAIAGGMGGWGAGARGMALTTGGAWTLEGTVVAGGAATAEVEVDLGALSVLHMAGSGRTKGGGASGSSGRGKTAAQGSGKWKRKRPTNPSERALDYQEQITGRKAWWVYMVEEQEFDGFDGLGLKEAKGPGYESFFNKDGTPKKWYVDSGKFRELIKQAEEQSRVAEKYGIPLTWYVADGRLAEFLARTFKGNSKISATVQHQAARF